MSSYNNIEKIKYASEDCVVTLREYIVFEDERAEEKFVVFKFANNVSQQLLGMEFEVSQYDIDNNLVEKSVVIYNKFLAKPDEHFVPKAKLKVNYACKTLSVRLIQAAFDRFVWKEGQFLDNSYKFSHYAADEDTEALKRAVQVKPAKVVTPPASPATKKRKGGMPFNVKDATRKNIAKFPAVLNFLILLIMLVAIGLSAYFFTSKSTSFNIGSFGVKVTGGSTVEITGYTGEDKNLVIPATLGDYTVVGIGENAFKNSEVESVKINAASVYINAYAFEGCAKLKTVASSAEMTVKANAFKDCVKLETVTLPNAALLTGSLSGCTGVKYLEIAKTDATNVESLFGGKLPATDPVIIIGGNQGGKPDDGGNTGGNQGGDTGFTYDPNATYEYGYLQDKGVDGYIKYDDCETVNGVVITVNPEKDGLNLKEEVKSFSDKVYPSLANIATMTVNGETAISADDAKAFTSLESLEISSSASGKSLTEFPNLKYLTLPCVRDDMLVNQYTFPNNLELLTLKPSAECAVIPNEAFYGINAKNIVVSVGFTSCGVNIMHENYDTVSLSLPAGIEYGESVISGECTQLTQVTVNFDAISVSYAQFNLSYMYTNVLIIHTGVISYQGFLANESNYPLSNLEIYADSATVSLDTFINGEEYLSTQNPSLTIINLKEEPDYFRDGYLGNIA